MATCGRMLVGVLAVAVAAAVSSACSSTSPSAPSASSLPIPSGRYVVTFSAPEFSGSGSSSPVPACVGSAAASITLVSLEFTGQNDGDAFRGAASTAASGTFKMQLQRALTMPGSTQPFVIPVTGWFQGTGTHQNFPFLPSAWPPNLVRFEGSAALQGEMAMTGFGMYGTVTGTVIFANPSGVEVRCNPGTVPWTLSQY